MCIIIYSPTGKIPKKHLQRSLTQNPDGWGYMFAKEGKLIIRKGMDRNTFWKSWKFDKVIGPVVWHSRIGTHGNLDETNCHPFEVPGHNLAMAHNGIISNCSFGKDKEKSDTRNFIDSILQGLPKNFLHCQSIRRLMRDYIGNSKLVFMDPEGKVCIINEGKGHWFCERWYSNTSYKAPKMFLVPQTEYDYTPNSRDGDDKPIQQNRLPLPHSTHGYLTLLGKKP